MELVIDNTQTVAVTERALTWPEQARAVTIASSETYERASEMLLGIKALRREIDEAFDPIISDAHRVHKTACTKKQQAEAPLVEAEAILKGGIGAYVREQERLRQAEERRLQDEARQAEETRRLNEAAALELEGNRTDNPELLYEANELIVQPVTTPPVIVPKTTPKIAGISTREQWDGRVTDLAKLIRFVAAHPEYSNLLQPNLVAIRAQARSLKGNLRIDGVQAFPVTVVAAGGR